MAHNLKRGLLLIILAVALCFFLEGCSGSDALAELIDGDVWVKDTQSVDEKKQEDNKKEIVIPFQGNSHNDHKEVEAVYDEAEDEYDELYEDAELGRILTDEEIMAATDGMVRYSYAKLNDDERKLYRDIYMVLTNHQYEVKIACLNVDRVDKVFQLVLNDHPEIFYVSGYSVNQYTSAGKTVALEFSGTYTKTQDEIEEAMPIIDEYVTACLKGIDEGASDREKALYLYEYLIENTDYELDAEDNQSILSVCQNGSSVCQGYAKTNQYILNKLGIPCILVQGRAKGEGHVWNKALLDGKWENIDVTWGDASYHDPNTKESWNEISYDYFGMDDKELYKTHTLRSRIDIPKSGDNFVKPMIQ